MKIPKVMHIVYRGVTQSVRHPRREVLFNHARDPDPPAKTSPVPWQVSVSVFVFSVIVMCVAIKFNMDDVTELMKVTASISFGFIFGLGTGLLHK